MQYVDYVVIGGGIVGLATAATLRPFGSVAVLEQHRSLIHETSSRNSGVVHAGIYYPESSLKTKLSMEGNANLWRFQALHPGKLKARRVGKWIGTSENSPAEEKVLQTLVANMKSRGIAHDMVSQSDQHRLEPHVRMHTVVNSTHAGILDVSSLRDALVETIESSPATTTVSGDNASFGFLAPNAQVERIHMDLDARDVTLAVRQLDSRDDRYTLGVKRALVCAVGLHGNELWKRIAVNGNRPVRQPPSHLLHFCKGRYTRYAGRTAPVRRLVYPCPLPQLVGLGVHSTVDMAGAVRFGPDALYTDTLDDYSFRDPSSAHDESAEAQLEAFVASQYEAVRRYTPSIEKERMVPDFVGIRPKLAGPGEPFRDFLFEEIVAMKPFRGDGLTPAEPVMKPLTGSPLPSATPDGPRVVMVTGIESPGLTASTAIGEYVTRSLLPDPELFERGLPPWRAPQDV